MVRFAPSPTGFLHIGGVHTALFNWLFARHEGGEFRLRIENTDTSREVDTATELIQESLSWLGLDWDGELTFQLDRMERCREEAKRLVAEGKGYEDEGAIRMRMPDEGTTAWDDLIRGRIEYPNEKIEDLVIVRADGRPTYNYASPIEDWLDGITHVLRGDDHISNTPKQIQILEALGAPLPEYGHLANILGPDGKKLSKRHGATSVEEFREQGYDWDEELVRATVPLVQEKISKLSEYPDFAGFFFREIEADPALLDGSVLGDAEQVLAQTEPFTVESIEQSLRELAKRLELKPREAFQPIRVAVTGSKVSPGLFESIELLGREATLARIRSAREAVV